MLSPSEVINFYLNNPPFEITDTSKYTLIIDYNTKQTLMELSENDPIIEEKEFTTQLETQLDEEYVLIDIYETIDNRLMTLIYLSEKNRIQNNIINYNIPNINKNISLLDIIALKDGIYKLKEATSNYIKKIIYKNKYIKLLPDTDYYCVYNRYKEFDELSPNEMITFTELFEINLFLRLFQSSTFSTEQGIRSVSISGLSVTLNVPTTEQAIKTLSLKKNKILYNIGLNDYTDLIGHF